MRYRYEEWWCDRQTWEGPNELTKSRRHAFAEVVGIVKRAWRPLVGVLDVESAIGNQCLVEPLDVRFPKVNISTRQVTRLARVAWRPFVRE